MKAYRCQHSGLLLPPDYKANWGIYYGHGLGPTPVSECLDSDTRAKINLTRVDFSEGPDKYMFPFHITRAAVDLVDVPEEEYNNPDNRMILALDDLSYKRRCDILRKKQQEKPEWDCLKVAMSAQPRSDRESWR